MRQPLFALILMASSGCVTVPTNAPPPRLPKVRIDGCCCELSEGARLSPAELLLEIKDYLGKQEFLSAACLVGRFPDLSEEILRSSKGTTQTVDFVAKTHDAFAGHDPGQGWQALLQGKKTSATLADLEDRLRVIRQHVEREEWRKAKAQLQRAQALSKDAYPRHALVLALYAVDMERRIGNPRDAAQAWQDAAFLAAGNPKSDPILWEKLHVTRPEGVAWPSEVGIRLAKSYRDAGDIELPSAPPDADTLTWLAVGDGRLERGEGKSALSAFKHAESTAAAALKPWARLRQAKALIALQQSTAAASLLTELSESQDESLRRAAFAVLGSSKLQDGHVQQAFVFLSKAVEGGGPFPGSANAIADLGLVCLTLGDEAKGLALLHQAQQAFERAGNLEHLARSLENECRYLSKTGHAAAAELLQRRIRGIEALDSGRGLARRVTVLSR